MYDDYFSSSVNIIDAKINGHAFLRLDERTLERFGVTLGFQLSLIDIIEGLVCYNHDIHLRYDTR